MRRFFAKGMLSAPDMNKLKDPNKKKFSHRAAVLDFKHFL
jgi:hypothetical protein